MSSILPSPSGYTVLTATETGDDDQPVQVLARSVLAWNIEGRDMGDDNYEAFGYPICANEKGYVEEVYPAKYDSMWLEFPSACCVSNYTAQAMARLAKKAGRP